MSQTEMRRKKIIEMLEKSEAPLTGSVLAEMFDVSRQVIVQDIAILKAEEMAITSTNRGYQLAEKTLHQKVVKVIHDDDRIADELYIIVDAGAKAEDVFISHKAYGIIRVPLNISSRRDVKKLMEDIEAGISKPLKGLTGGYHYHTLSAENDLILDEVEKELERQDFLVKPIKEASR